jgi:hypothetical protein
VNATAENGNPTLLVNGERPTNSGVQSASSERQRPSQGQATNAEPQNNIRANDIEEVRLEILHLESLLGFLDKEFQPMKEKMETLMSKNTLTFDVLWLLYPEGSEIIFKDLNTDLKRGGKVWFPLRHFL